MKTNEAYLEPAGHGEAELVEKRSRFIGRVWRVGTEAEAAAHIRKMRETNWDAAHNVYAYIVHRENLMRYSDDGEPQGTAGIPTLGVFKNERISNVCCVVTRYFGGTLLGAGGLVRAYSRTAKLALDAAGISAVRLWKQLLISCTYGQLQGIRREILGAGGVLERIHYGADVLIEALMPAADTAALAARLADMTAGTVDIEIVGETTWAVRI